MKRTKYTTELKLEAVKQILEKGHSATDVASRSCGPAMYLDPKTQGASEKLVE